MKIKFLLLFVIVVFSCQQHTRTHTDKINGELIVNIGNEVVLVDQNTLKISLDVLVQEDTIFDIFYTSDSINEPFNNEKRIFTKVKGSENPQTVTLLFPEGIMPYNFRIDLGDNALKKETNIEISTINVKLNNKDIVINRQILDHFFIANEYLKKTDLGYLRMVYANKYDPYLLASPTLLAKMRIEF
jgi:hypothetical protein